MMTPEKLTEILQAGFTNAQIHVTGEGNKFDLRIVDESFQAKRPVARQQSVYALLNDYIASGDIHAVNIQAYTEEEWKSKSRFG